MGVYLSSPITEKESVHEKCEGFIYGASSMQGWRITQEDAHNCIPVFDEKTKTSFFAVYDGHGGPEVAKYCEKYFPDFIKSMIDGASEEDLSKIVQTAFLAFDATLTVEDVVKELKDLAGKDDENDEEEEADDPVGRTEADMLKEEATMPLDQLLAQYNTSTPEEIKNLRQKEAFQSPALRSAGGQAGGSSSAASSSSLSSQPGPVVANGEQTARADSSDCINSNNNNNNVGDKPKDSCSSESMQSTPVQPPQHNGVKAVAIQSGSSSSSSSSLPPSSSLSSSSAGSKEEGQVTASGSGSGSEERSSKVKAQVDMAKVDTALDSSDDDDEEEEEYMWEDMSDDDDDDDDDEEEEVDEDVPMMDMTNEEPGSDSGCTACVALLQQGRLLVANAGDSRCVLSRAGQAVDLSFDHKPEDDPERERIEKAGGKVTSDGRVNGGLNLSRAIGDHVYKRAKNLLAREQMITAWPDIETTQLVDQDQFIVIACDGIWNFMSSQEVVDFVSAKLKESTNRKNPALICEQLFDHCLAPHTIGDGTGCDNMTCIIIVRDSFVQILDSEESLTEAAEKESSTQQPSDPGGQTDAEKKECGKRCASDGGAAEGGKKVKTDDLPA